MPNPFVTAIKGKGFSPMMARGWTLTQRYGLTSAKLDRALAQLARILHEFDCKATLPVTTTALSRNQALVRKLQAQGLELAVHGYTHVDYTKLSFEQQRTHLRLAQQIFVNAGVTYSGFRSPYLRTNADFLRALLEAGFLYDSSQSLAWDVTAGLETSSYNRALEFYGAHQKTEQLALPRLDDGLVRIPYCLPDDEALIERLHLQDGQAMADIWLAMLDSTYEGGELFTLGLHPERALLCKKSLWAVLEKARSLSPGVWIARLDEIARWQRALEQAKIQTDQDGSDGWRIVVQGMADVALLARGIDITCPAQIWSGKYKCVSANKVNVRSNLRPWIGLSPNCPSSLQDFLHQQGYLTENSYSADGYPFFLQRSTFNPEDERLLLGEIETGDWPLVRIARWPGGAKAALAITGDIDAFTLWDYGHRIING